MKTYTVLTLIVITGFLISCNDSSSGAELSKGNLEKVQLTGNLSYSVPVDSSFSDTLKFISGKVGDVNLGDNKPEWINVEADNEAKQIIIHGETPAETGSYDMNLNITGDQETSTNPSFGFSFTLSVIDL